MSHTKGMKLSKEHREKIAEGVRRAHRDGKVKSPLARKRARESLEARWNNKEWSENKKRGNRREAEKMKDKPVSLEHPHAAKEDNCHAKSWVFKHITTDRILSGKNLAHLVRTHKDWFQEKHVSIDNKRRQPIAEIALGRLARGVTRSWMGWVALAKPHETA